MASFLSGPAAQLVGAGMQAIGVGIPVGQTSAKVIEGLRDCGLPVPPKNWFKRKDDASSKDQQQQQQQARDERSPGKTIYDKLESHINGMMQVVKPAIELKKLVRENCCKSAERRRRASSESPKDKLKFYTPQKCSSAVCNLFDNEQKSPSAKRKTKNKPNKCGKRRCGRRDSSSSSDGEQQCCMYCSRSRSCLLRLPCGRLICFKCEENADHESECKQCKAAEKHRVYT